MNFDKSQEDLDEDLHHQGDEGEDVGFYSMEYSDYKVEFECISKQEGRDDHNNFSSLNVQ